MKFAATVLALLAATAVALPGWDDNKDGKKGYVTSKPFEYPTCSYAKKTHTKTGYKDVHVTKTYVDYKHETKTTEVPKHITTYKYVTKTVTKTKYKDEVKTKKEKVRTHTKVCKDVPTYTWTHKVYTTHVPYEYPKEYKDKSEYVTETKVHSTYRTKVPYTKTKVEEEKKPYTTEYVKKEKECKTVTGWKTYTAYKPHEPRPHQPKPGYGHGSKDKDDGKDDHPKGYGDD